MMDERLDELLDDHRDDGGDLSGEVSANQGPSNWENEPPSDFYLSIAAKRLLGLIFPPGWIPPP